MIKEKIIGVLRRIRNIAAVTFDQFLALGSGIASKVNAGAPKEDITVILPAAHRGSKGDDAMLHVVLNWIHERRPTDKIWLVSYKKSDSYPEFEGIDRILDGSGYIRWLPGPIATFRLWRELRSTKTFYAIGADVLDGKYGWSTSFRRILLARYCGALALNSTILNFSVNPDTPNYLRKAFVSAEQNGARLIAREPRSHARLEEFGLEHSLGGADLAFLMKPLEWSDASFDTFVEKAKGNPVFGLNLNSTLIRMAGADRSDSIDKLVNSAVDLISKLDSHLNSQVGIVLIPHDWRAGCSDQDLAIKVHESVRDKVKCPVFLIDHELDVRELKWIVGHCSVLLTGRMHLGISALSQKVPTLFWDYQGKIEGLLNLFGLEQMAVNPSTFFDGTVIDQVTECLEQEQAIRDTIMSRLPDVVALSGRLADVEVAKAGS